jgi:hypothetical protein
MHQKSTHQQALLQIDSRAMQVTDSTASPAIPVNAAAACGNEKECCFISVQQDQGSHRQQT